MDRDNRELIDNDNINTDSEQAAVAASGFGKFDSAEKLLNAYNSLEAEFTKRCQQIKELRTANEQMAARVQADGRVAGKARGSEERFDSVTRDDDSMCEEIIAAYLARVYETKSTALLNASVGRSALSPVKKPRSLSEAKELADRYFF